MKEYIEYRKGSEIQVCVKNQYDRVETYGFIPYEMFVLEDFIVVDHRDPDYGHERTWFPRDRVLKIKETVLYQNDK